MWLVRTPERRAARKSSFDQIKALSGQGLYEHTGTALSFAQATSDIAREDHASELGALKMFDPRGAGPEALARMRNEIAVLRENRPGLLRPACGYLGA